MDARLLGQGGSGGSGDNTAAVAELTAKLAEIEAAISPYDSAPVTIPAGQSAAIPLVARTTYNKLWTGHLNASGGGLTETARFVIQHAANSATGLVVDVQYYGERLVEIAELTSLGENKIAVVVINTTSHAVAVTITIE